MKKPFVYSFIILFTFAFLLSPLNVNAQEGYETFYKRLYQNIGHTNLGTGGGYDYNVGNINSGSFGNIYLYPIDTTVQTEKYDYLLFQGYVDSSVFGYVDTTTITDWDDYNQIIQTFGITLKVNMRGSANNSNTINRGSSCIITPNISQTTTRYTFTGVCPFPHDMTNIVDFQFTIYNDCDKYHTLMCASNTPYGFAVAIDASMTLHFNTDGNNDDVVGAINDTTDAINDTTDAINDMNSSINNSSVSSSTSTASSFFSGFSTEPTGHLTSIVTAPLTLMSAITSSTCNPISIPVSFGHMNNRNQTLYNTDVMVRSNTITLPCGTTLFWENADLGNDVTSFRTFWNILIGGPIIYGCLLLLMRSFNNAIDPLNDELVTIGFTNDQVKNDSDSSGYVGKHTRSGYEGRHGKK